MDDAQNAGRQDTKSSMGDKYETTREMMQIELNKLGTQLREVQDMQLALKVIDPLKTCRVAESGALVQTNSHTFYIAAGLGKLQVNGSQVMVISKQSPMAKAMWQRQQGETFSLNGLAYQIVEIA